MTSQAYDDFLRGLMERLESLAAPDAAAKTSADGANGAPSIPPVTVEMQRVLAAEAPASFRLSWQPKVTMPVSAIRAYEATLTPEHPRTLNLLRQLQAQAPQNLEDWRRRNGLPSIHSTVDPWDDATKALPTSSPMAPPASFLALPLPPSEAVEQAPKLSEPADHQDGDEGGTTPTPGQAV